MLKIANNACDNKFYILGKKLIFKDNINWHNPDWYNPDWYNPEYIKKIKKNYSQDIKYAWELSRLYHAPALALVYLKTGEQKYLDCYIKNINSWLDNNPFLTGVNWTNPMEASIRAINLIYSFNYLKDNKNISDSFWIKLLNNLYLHKIYIENNWEIYYKNNNHYLADLLGAFYLNLLFFNKNKIIIYKNLLKEFDKQFLPDGTNYEGSTSYHKLSTEMFLHFYNLCKQNNLKINNRLLIKLKRALKFIKLNKINKKEFLQIGDNDSGRVLSGIGYKKDEIPGPAIAQVAMAGRRVQDDKHGIFTCDNKNNYNFNCHAELVSASRNKKTKTLFHYKNFGLSIIKNNNYHITYRHPTFNKTQPTGHFHQDELSVTFAYNNTPIIVDPGTYLYTGNTKARNLFRSYGSHSTINYIQTKDPSFVAGMTSLFTLDKQEQKDTSIIKKNKNKYLIKNYFKNNNIKIIRNLLFHGSRIESGMTSACGANNQEKLIILDKIENSKNIIYLNFNLHQTIKIKKINNKKFELTDKNNNIFVLKSNVNLQTKKSFYSQRYGKIKKTLKIYLKIKINKNIIKTIIYKK